MEDADWNKLNWESLGTLRGRYLAKSSGLIPDYWRDEELLRAYDLTFAARIGWKWDAVLRELKARGFQFPTGLRLIDWGCGSGIASRKIIEHYGPASFSDVCLSDRSGLATEYARKRLLQEAPMLKVTTHSVSKINSSVPFALVVSHVLSELNNAGYLDLMTLANAAQIILWVEPGTHRESRKLIETRQALMSTFNIIAPCTHQMSCGMLASQNAKHWCHNFAEPPSTIFHNTNWKKFSDQLGIDLRSLPVSYLVMDKSLPAVKIENQTRVIGYARKYKGYCKFLACNGHEGVLEKRMLKRVDTKLFKELCKGGFTQLVDNTLGDPI